MAAAIAGGGRRAQPVVSEEQAEAFAAALELAHKVLNDREPEAKDKVRSLVDQEVRTGKHGDYYDGYLLDVSMDADSELLCAMDVLPANADEAANAKQLIAREEQAHGNDVASLSIDRIGYRGDVLAALSDAADGPQVTVYVPPIDWMLPAPELFQPEVFTLNAAGDEVCCPGGATSRTRKRTRQGHGWRFRFRASQCQRVSVTRAVSLPADHGRPFSHQERLCGPVPRCAAAGADRRVSGGASGASPHRTEIGRLDPLA